MNDPGARDVTFDQVRTAYAEQVQGLLDGGVDLLLVETIFDTLNAKVALFAIQEHFDAHPERRVPIMVSGTITDLSGRTLTGQTVEAFYTSVSHAPLLSIGLNCALGPKEMRPYIEELSRIAPIYVSCYPNAGLPEPLSPTGFPETPETLAPQIREVGGAGLAEHRRGAAAARRPRTSRPSPMPCATARRAGCQPSSGGCGSAGWRCWRRERVVLPFEFKDDIRTQYIHLLRENLCLLCVGHFQVNGYTIEHLICAVFGRTEAAVKFRSDSF